MSKNQSQENSDQKQGRLDRISRTAGATSTTYNKKYSLFIRWMRLILPMIAIAIMAVVFTWSTDTQNIPAPQENNLQQSIGKNELLNPRFESQDDKKQPYTITAKRALQGETNENLIILEEPLADMLLNTGSWLAIKANQGAFLQDNKRLLLKGNVQIYHDQGYQMNMAQLNVDMDKNTAWTDVDVYGQGPEGTIEAKGLQSDSQNGLLIFNGPAKLTLIEGGMALGGIVNE